MACPYGIYNLLQDLETTTDLNKVALHLMLQVFAWDGAHVTIGEQRYNIVCHALQHQCFQAFRVLIEHGNVKKEETNHALMTLCAAPQHKTILLQLLLDHGADAHYQGSSSTDDDDDSRNTPLHVAYQSGQASTEFLHILCQHMDVNIPNAAGQTVLHMALLRGDTVTVRLLLRHGANPNLCDASKEGGQLPLVMACHLPDSDSCLQLLLRHGADIHRRDANGRTALRLSENPAASMVLLERGARSDVADPDSGATPLHTALSLWCRWRRGANLWLLLFDERHVADLLWSTPDESRSNSRYIRRTNYRLNITDQAGRTPLHYACEVPYTPAPEYAAALVTRGGANLHARDVNGWTPLHVAIAFGNYATAVRLMDLGALTGVKDDRGRTPLHLLGMEAQAAELYPDEPLAYSVRLVAFGPSEAPKAAYIPPLSKALQEFESSSREQDEDDAQQKQQEQEIRDQAAIDLIQAFLYRGFDFLMADLQGNLPFFAAAHPTAHYLAIQAAASQGLF